MVKTILTDRQKTLLNLLGNDKTIKKYFYFTCGTALAEFYLHHRYSEDLDFFSQKEVEPLSIQIILN